MKKLFLIISVIALPLLALADGFQPSIGGNSTGATITSPTLIDSTGTTAPTNFAKILAGLITSTSNKVYAAVSGSDTLGNGTIYAPYYSPGLAVTTAGILTSNTGPMFMADIMPGTYNVSPTNANGTISMWPNMGYYQEPGAVINSSYQGASSLGIHAFEINSGDIIFGLNIVW